MKKILLILFLLFLFPLASALISNTTEGFAGFLQDSNTGEYISSANITLNISTSASCTANVIYSEMFVNNVSNGVFSLLAGNYKEHLNLEYGRDYWSCYEVNNGSSSEIFGADPFTSGKGIISAEYLNISKTYFPFNISVRAGVIDAGNLNSILNLKDGDSFNVSEVAGANPLDIVINFTGVTNLNQIVYRIWYIGGVGHEIEVGLWDTTTDSYEEEYAEITDMDEFAISVIPVIDSSDHIDGGNVSLRFRHVQNGIPSHDFYIDYAVVVEGISVLTGSDHDSLGGRDDKENHPWAFPTDATRVLTGRSINFTGTTPNYIFGGDASGDDFIICANNIDNKPCLQLDGNAVAFLIGGTDVVRQLGDNVGVTKDAVHDSAGLPVAYTDSDGNANFEGCVRLDAGGGECSQAESLVVDKNITGTDIYLGNNLYSDNDNDKRLDWTTNANRIDFYPSETNIQNYIIMQSDGTTAASPVLYPNANHEGRLGVSSKYWHELFVDDIFTKNIIAENITTENITASGYANIEGSIDFGTTLTQAAGGEIVSATGDLAMDNLEADDFDPATLGFLGLICHDGGGGGVAADCDDVCASHGLACGDVYDLAGDLMGGEACNVDCGDGAGTPYDIICYCE